MTNDVRRTIDRLERYVTRLREYTAIHGTQDVERATVERYVQLGLESMAEIAVAICENPGARGLNQPRDPFVEAQRWERFFVALGEEQSIPAGTAEKLGEFARFRDRLIYTYVDNDRLVTELDQYLEAMETFVRQVDREVERREDAPRGG